MPTNWLGISTKFISSVRFFVGEEHIFLQPWRYGDLGKWKVGQEMSETIVNVYLMNGTKPSGWFFASRLNFIVIIISIFFGWQKFSMPKLNPIKKSQIMS
jgi:hypothetical protein